MRFQELGIIAAAAAYVGLVGCSGISDCEKDAAKCATMLNEQADKCAFSYQLRQSEKKRKYCERAVKVVGDAKEKAAIPGLITILNTAETNTPRDRHRAEAAKALAKIGDASAIDPLLAAIDLEAGSSADDRDKNANLSNESIANALGDLGDKKACGKLVELMGRSRHDYSILKAIRSLGQLKCNDAVEAVSDVALKHDNKFMRKNAVIALGEIGDVKAADALIQMMFVEYQGVSFYPEASFSLFQVGPAVADGLLKTMAGENVAVNAYFKKRGGLQTTAIKAKCGVVLSDLRDVRAVEPLIEAFKAAITTDPALVIYASPPLGALGDKRAVPVLASQMEDADASKRGPVMSALNVLGDRSVAAKMIKAMTKAHFVKKCLELGASQEACDGDKASYYGAAKAATDNASNLAGAEHVAAYEKAVADTVDVPLKDYMTKRMVRVKAAGECKLDSGCWVTKLSDDNALVREKAAWELMRIKDKGTLGALKKALGDKNAYTRLAAITAYWSFGDKSAVPEIEARLKKEEGAADFVNVNRDLKRLLVALRRR